MIDIGKTTQPIKDKEALKRYFSYLNEYEYEMFILSAIMYHTGFRVGDVRYLTVADVKGEFLEINERKTRYKEQQHKQDIRAGKKKPRKIKKIRKIPIEPVLRKHIIRYISGKANHEYLFPSPHKNKRTNGEPISYFTIEKKLKQAAKAAGIKEDTFGTHALRKTAIWEVYNQYGIVEAQAYVGHETVEQTKVYLGITQEMANRGAKAISDILSTF